MKKDFVCQEDFGHKMLGVTSMFVVGRELRLFRVESAMKIKDGSLCTSRKDEIIGVPSQRLCHKYN